MEYAVATLPDSVAACGERKLRLKDLTLDDIVLDKYCPLDDGHFTAHTTPATLTTPTDADQERPRKRQKRGRPEQDRGGAAGASALERLPMEVLFMTLVLLDIPTIVSTRRASRRIMASIDALHPYRQIRTHCPDVLRAAVGLSARSFDLATLYEALRSPICEECGNACDGSLKRSDRPDSDSDSDSTKKGRLAGYLYLITCTRVCYDCFVFSGDYFPVSLAQAAKALVMPKSKVLANSKEYPHIRTIPGHYTWWKKIEKKSSILVDRAAVQRGILQLQVAESHVLQTVPKAIYQSRLDQTTTEVWRHVAIISVPYFAPSRQTVDWGFHCVKCADCKAPATHFRLKYTRDGLVQHLKEHHSVEVNE